MVWRRAERDGFVGDVQAMRRRVRRAHPGRTRPSGSSSSAPAGCATSSSRSSCSSSCTAAPTSRSARPTTLSALAALTDGRLRRPRGRRGAARGLRVPAHPRAPDPAASSCAAPTSCPTTRRRCAGSAARMGYLKDPVAALDKRVAAPPPRGAPAAREAVLPAAARPRSPGSPATRPGSSPEAAGPRLAALGFVDPTAALRHLEALTAGVTRTANIQRTLLPVMLDWFADAPDPDAGLFGFRRISESLGRPRGTSRRCATRARSPSGWPACSPPRRYATDLLRARAAGRADARRGPRRRSPPRRSPRRCWPPAGRQDDPDDGGRARSARVRRRELFRIAAGDLLGEHRRRRRRRRACPGSPTPPSRRRSTSPAASVRGAARARRARRPGWRSSRWAATAASSCPTAATPTCCSCTTRSPGADPQAASTYAQAVANELRRLLALPGGRPAAGGRRRPAARGQAGPAGAHPRLLRRLLREVVAGLGGPGAAARRRRRRRRGPAAAVHRADRPAALPGGRASADGRRRRGTPDQGARRRRAAAARRRPAHPPQARPRRAGRHRVDRAAAADAARRQRCPGCARRGPSRRSAPPREAGAAVDADDADDAGRRPGGWSAGCATRSRWCAARPATSCRATPASGPRWPRVLGYPAGGSPTRWSTTTCAPRVGRTRSSTGSSGNEGHCFTCRHMKQ